MNKLYLILSVLCISVHDTNWAMLTVSKIKQIPCSSEKYFTQERIERSKSRVSEESQVFLNSFGQHSMKKTGDMFCNLSIRAKQRVLPCISHNQKLLVWCGANDLTTPFLSAVFNSNQKVALMYSQKPIGEILEAYASAKEMMKWCPLFMKDDVNGVLKEHHYMVLKDSQRIFLADIDKKATIHSADVLQFMNILKILHDIDSETVGMDDIKAIIDSVKLDLSLSERGRIFYSMIPHGSLKQSFLITSVVAGIGAPIVLAMVKALDNYAPELEVLGVAAATITSAAMTSFWIGFLPAIYFQMYRNHLKTNILPNQSTLTDYLKKTAR